ncbi:MAG: protein kinase [Methanoregula sp.]|nr:protein kinase [Methanoregula sp.]
MNKILPGMNRDEFSDDMTHPALPIRLALIILLILGSASVPGVFAAEYTVASSGALFTEIQPAIKQALPGDTIIVASGLYPEKIRIDKSIVLAGIDSGKGAPVLDPQYEGTAVEIIADGCTVKGFEIQHSNLMGGIRVTSSGNSIADNTLKKNVQGIVLISADKNSITGNTITDNTGTGITLEGSGDNLIENNRVLDNPIGIMLDDASRKNQIYHNSFANTQNVIATSATSDWESQSAVAYTYHGGAFNSRMGNYWGDYHGQDPNGDGIGATPYVISIAGNSDGIRSTSQDVLDLFPLMDPKDTYHAIFPASGTSVISNPVFTAVVTPPVLGTTTPRNPILPTTAATLSPVITLPPLVMPDMSRVPWVPVLVGVLLLCGAGGAVFWYRRRKPRRQSPQDALRIVPSGTPDTIPFSTTVTQPDELLQSLETTGTVGMVKRSDRSDPVDEPGTADTVPDSADDEPAGSGQQFYLPPDLKSKYSGIRYIGRGGVAHVFAAHRKTDGKLVAVKIPISFDEITGKCFLNEIALWKKLSHPNIVEVLATNILPVPYVEMEYIPGSLDDVTKPIPVWKAVHLVNSIADALQYAHSRGIIHRDIKPHNILMTAEFVPKITDWGMSKIISTEMQKSSVSGFSLSYAAPEQVSPADFGRTDARTDIYQLGVVFYELVTGSIPFGGDSIVEVGNAIVREDPIPPSKYNPDAALVEKIILKCLRKDPADRYQTAGEISDALSSYLDEDEE